MSKIVITLDSISEYHEPDPYKHYVSVIIDVYRGEQQNLTNRYYHRCEDIKGIDPVDSEREALALANSWLAQKVNIDKIIQEIIAAIGE